MAEREEEDAVELVRKKNCLFNNTFNSLGAKNVCGRLIAAERRVPRRPQPSYHFYDGARFRTTSHTSDTKIRPLIIGCHDKINM